ncbi:MAG: glycosyltransferase family 4 protein [Verrucomicrobiota bacterium]
MKPRIAFCNEDFMSTRGGVSVLVEELIQGLSDRYRIVLASRDAPGALPSYLVPHVEDHISIDKSAALPAGRMPFADALKRREVALAHFHLPGVYGWGTRLPRHSPIPFVKQAGIATVATCHMATSLLRGYCGDFRPAWFRLLLLPRSWTAKFNALRHLDAEIAVSRRNEAQLRSWYFPVRDRFRLIYHSRLRASDIVASASLREKAILAVGHIAFRKGQPVLIKAFAGIADRFPDWKLWLVGHFAEEACRVAVEEEIRASGLGGRIELLGRREDAADWMKRAGVYVQPSLSEGLPLSLQEALACGCPCVATRIPGNDELVEEGENGLFVPANDASAMGRALARLLENTALRESLSARAPGSILARKMSYESMLAAHCALYDSILSRRA